MSEKMDLSAKRWADLSQAAAAYPVFSRRTLERMLADRQLPFYKVRGRLLIDLDDLDTFIAAGLHEAINTDLRGTTNA